MWLGPSIMVPSWISNAFIIHLSQYRQIGFVTIAIFLAWSFIDPTYDNETRIKTDR